MSTQITVDVRKIGAEDIAWDTEGGNQHGFFVTNAGGTLTYTYINTSHIPIDNATRPFVGLAGTLDEALQNLSESIQLQGGTAQGRMPADTTLQLGSDPSQWQTAINTALKNLNNHTLTILFPNGDNKTMTSSLDFSNFFGGQLVIDLNGTVLTAAADMDAMFHIYGCSNVELTGGTAGTGKMIHSASNGCAVMGSNTSGVLVTDINFTGNGGTASYALVAYNTQFSKDEDVTLTSDNLIIDHAVSDQDVEVQIAAHNTSGSAHENRFSLMATKNSPVLTGVPTTPNILSGGTGTQIANKNYVDNAVTGFAPTDSPTFTGTARYAVTIGYTDNSDLIANTQFVQGVLYNHTNTATTPNPHSQYMLKSGGTFTGSLYAQSPTAAENSGMVATTAWVKGIFNDYIVSSGTNTNGWYRIYKSGWIEQGGLKYPSLYGSELEEGSHTIVFPYEFANIDYVITGAIDASVVETYGGGFEISNVSTTQCNACLHDGGNGKKYMAGMRWYACGIKKG